MDILENTMINMKFFFLWKFGIIKISNVNSDY